MRKKTNENIYVSSEQTIDRSRWVFGNYSSILGESWMLNEEDNMCCLGQICYNSGVGTDVLERCSSPSGVLRVLKDTFLDIPYLADSENKVGGTKLSLRAMHVNDFLSGTLAERESKLRTLFKEYGIKLKFKGKYPKALLQEISNEDS